MLCIPLIVISQIGKQHLHRGALEGFCYNLLVPKPQSLITASIQLLVLDTGSFDINLTKIALSVFTFQNKNNPNPSPTEPGFGLFFRWCQNLYLHSYQITSIGSNSKVLLHFCTTKKRFTPIICCYLMHHRNTHVYCTIRFHSKVSLLTRYRISEKSSML